MSEAINLNNPDYYINRQISWIDFNQRVLDQALSKDCPIIERLKFLCIFSSNLDEFFMIRVAGLQQQMDFHSQETGPDGILPNQQLELIAEKVHKLVETQYKCYHEDIHPKLVENGIKILDINQISKKQEEYIKDYWDNAIFPVLTPLAVDPSHPFPHLINRSINIAVELKSPDEKYRSPVYFAFVQVPKVIKRFISLPSENKEKHFVLLDDIIDKYIFELFPGLEISSTARIRITRNSDLDLVEEEASDLLKTIQEEVRRRDWGNVVRLEVSNKASKNLLEMLISALELEPLDTFVIDGPLNLPDFFEIYNLNGTSHLKDETFISFDPFNEPTKSIFSVLRKKDVLLYHPYESFQGVIDFISKAAEDPKVLGIKQTLYRTGRDSPFVKALIKAAENGKQVTALVELKARFDEEDNIEWAKKLEQAGVNVVYGLIGLKTHCKMSMVIRKEEDKIRRYIHLSTGNYNHNTAKLYTDIGFFTTDKSFGSDVSLLFNVVTGYSKLPPLKKISAAPINMREKIEELINRETENKKAGKKAKIIAKMNSLVDSSVIKYLYEASMAGVKIDLIVRGICCLRPKLPGISENIRVFSILDRFLEHSRVFYFYNEGKEDIYLSSADWMPRNLDRRVEVMFPIENDLLKGRLMEEVLYSQLKDNTNRYELEADGKYYRIQKASENDEIYRDQFVNLKLTDVKNSLVQIPIHGISSDLLKKKKKEKK